MAKDDKPKRGEDEKVIRVDFTTKRVTPKPEDPKDLDPSPAEAAGIAQIGGSFFTRIGVEDIKTAPHKSQKP